MPTIRDVRATLKFLLSHPLSCDNRLRTLIRFARWQIGTRLISDAVIHDWVNGARFICRRGETGLTGNIYCGLHEFAGMAIMLHLLRPEDLFVDIGANVGAYTLLACRSIGARGYCFEPVPSTFSRLLDNIKLNNLENAVRCMNIGIGDKCSTISFTSSQGTQNHVLEEGETASDAILVEVATLDSLLQNEAPFLMKIDVEGFETPVLKGAADTLANNSLCAVIMELNGLGARYGFDESTILQMMKEYGFATYNYDPFGRQLADLGGKISPSGNTLFVRNAPIVRDRLSTAPTVGIHGKVF